MFKDIRKKLNKILYETRTMSAGKIFSKIDSNGTERFYLEDEAGDVTEFPNEDAMWSYVEQMVAKGYTVDGAEAAKASRGRREKAQAGRQADRQYVSRGLEEQLESDDEWTENEDGDRVNRVDYYVGRRMKRARRLLGLSQGQLSSEVGISVHDLQEYEKGTRSVSKELLERIAERLDVTVQYFYEEMTSSKSATMSEGFKDTDLRKRGKVVDVRLSSNSSPYIEVSLKDGSVIEANASNHVDSSGRNYDEYFANMPSIGDEVIISRGHVSTTWYLEEILKKKKKKKVSETSHSATMPSKGFRGKVKRIIGDRGSESVKFEVVSDGGDRVIATFPPTWVLKRGIKKVRVAAPSVRDIVDVGSTDDGTTWIITKVHGKEISEKAKKCWKTHKTDPNKPTKKKGGETVRNCVKK